MNLFDHYIDNGLHFVKKKCVQAIPQVFTSTYHLYIMKFVSLFYYCGISLPDFYIDLIARK